MKATASKESANFARPDIIDYSRKSFSGCIDVVHSYGCAV